MDANDNPQGVSPQPPQDGSAAPLPCRQSIRRRRFRRVLKTLLIGGSAGGIFTSVLIISPSMGLAGASRTARLKMQARQAEIAQAAAEQQPEKAQTPPLADKKQGPAE